MIRTVILICISHLFVVIANAGNFNPDVYSTLVGDLNDTFIKTSPSDELAILAPLSIDKTHKSCLLTASFQNNSVEVIKFDSRYEYDVSHTLLGFGHKEDYACLNWSVPGVGEGPEGPLCVAAPRAGNESSKNNKTINDFLDSWDKALNYCQQNEVVNVGPVVAEPSKEFVALYSQAYEAFLKRRYKKAVMLLKKLNNDFPPLYLSNIMLANSLQALGEHGEAIRYLKIIPEEQQGASVWGSMMVSYLALKGEGINIKDINETLEKYVTYKSFYPDGAVEQVYAFLKMFPNPKANAIFCHHLKINQGEDCR